MAAKQMLYDTDARAAMLEGASALAAAVSPVQRMPIMSRVVITGRTLATRMDCLRFRRPVGIHPASRSYRARLMLFQIVRLLLRRCQPSPRRLRC